LLLVKSTTKKIMGGLIPIKFQKLNGSYSSALADNSSLIFFYDDNKFRKCPQMNGQAKAFSRTSDWIVGLGNSSNGLCLAINKTKTSC
jgi:hypothetical protein